MKTDITCTVWLDLEDHSPITFANVVKVLTINNQLVINFENEEVVYASGVWKIFSIKTKEAS